MTTDTDAFADALIEAADAITAAITAAMTSLRETAHRIKAASPQTVAAPVQTPHLIEPHESRAALLRARADQDAVRLVLAGNVPTARKFGKLYGKGETWGGDRLRAAHKIVSRQTGHCPTCHGPFARPS